MNSTTNPDQIDAPTDTRGGALGLALTIVLPLAMLVFFAAVRS